MESKKRGNNGRTAEEAWFRTEEKRWEKWFYMGMEKSEISKEIERGTSRGSSVPCNYESCLGADEMQKTIN